MPYSINLASIRQHLHAYPELGLEEVKTATFLSDLLQSFGLEVTRNIGGTGIVASLRRGKSNQAIGLRADMDGLPICESAQHGYTSRHKGCMHACGHDGHGAQPEKTIDPIVIGSQIVTTFQTVVSRNIP